MATDGAAPGGRGKLTLRQLIGEMSPGELWGTVGAVVTLAVGAFFFGSWVKGREAELIDRGRANEIAQAKAEGDLKLEQVKLDAAKARAQADQDIARLGGEVAALKADRRVLAVKCEFFENCDRYHRGQRENEAFARKLFIDFYTRLASLPDDKEKNGFLIRHGQSGSSSDCTIEFADSAVVYHVPKDVKGGAILNTSQLPPRP
jgi:hypothetical protein